MLCVVLRARATVVAIRRKYVLSVRVNIEIQPDTAGITELVDLSDNTAVLRGVTRRSALVSLGARVSRGAVCKFPFIRPVPVDVCADAGVAGDDGAVLAPEAVGGLRVDEAVWVDDGGDVEVELVDERLDGGVRGVLGQELPGKVLGGHGCDPFARVDVAVDDDCWLGAAASASPDLDTGQGAALDGGSGCDDGGVACVAGLQVSQELEVVGVWVVGGEPRLRWH